MKLELGEVFSKNEVKVQKPKFWGREVSHSSDWFQLKCAEEVSDPTRRFNNGK